MRLTVNGQPYDLAIAGHESLVAILRGRLGLTGTKVACGRGECGACTVLIDGKPAYACLTLAAACEGAAVSTIEGLGAAERLHALQQAFIAHDALQCGFCTPGQIMAAAALLAQTPRPTEAEVRHGMSGNLCRCGAYPKIVRAVLDAAQRLEAARGA
ncbi:MAG: (2Fe-2S)-binding protein [Gemmatimonadota bacterium]|nr:(2Fe-2S)-binding protein [Gemmatimonadota bacterium]MDE3172599.1 (2Fe-2S)-binding protein [Gemmatimonadota bacterium]MDE3216049.1 (2Fe-2S)-binding protein [Gemmatimonadota bacterium]